MQANPKCPHQPPGCFKKKETHVVSQNTKSAFTHERIDLGITPNMKDETFEFMNTSNVRSPFWIPSGALVLFHVTILFEDWKKKTERPSLWPYCHCPVPTMPQPAGPPGTEHCHRAAWAARPPVRVKHVRGGGAVLPQHVMPPGNPPTGVRVAGHGLRFGSCGTGGAVGGVGWSSVGQAPSSEHSLEFSPKQKFTIHLGGWGVQIWISAAREWD